MFALRAAGIGALLILASFSSIGQVAAHESLAPRYHTGNLELAQAGAATTAEPDYDEQIGATFVQSLPSLTFNVTALAQTGADGYGPAYILNGLTSEGYWYQVGVSYHWPSTNGGYASGFGFNYQVYAPDDRSVYPSQGSGLGTFSKTVDSGDTVLLSLTFSGSSVLMTAEDLETGGEAQASYSSFGSTTFVGDTTAPSNSAGYFSGIMTEWYRVGEYTGSEGKVTYSDNSITLSGAWLWADEFDSASTSAPPVFDNQTNTPVIFDGSNVYPFESNGATVYGSAHQFITGLLNSSTSDLTLKPASTETAAPTFEATYTLAGLQQTSEVGVATTSVIEADPGSSITVTANSTADGGLERWVFSGTSGSSVTIPAGENATYVYYELVSEQVSSAVADGSSSLPSSPVLTYYVPASTSASSPTTVETTQKLTGQTASIMAVVGTPATVLTSIASSVSGERWTPEGVSWVASAPDVIPNPIVYYEQYETTVEYLIAGGGTPPETPVFVSTSLGSPVTLSFTGSAPYSSVPLPSGDVFGGSAQDWLDSGSSFSMTGTLNGSATSERWLGSQYASGGGSAPSVLAPDITLVWTFTHQYLGYFGVNDPSGGSVSPASGWFDAGSNVNGSASTSPLWQFEHWSGSGGDTYNGTSPTFSKTVTGPFTENATFYAQLAVTAGAGDRVTYSYGSQTGSISPGGTDDLYVPPGSNVTLRATPSSILYSFTSWRTSSSNSTAPSLAVVVNSPGAVAASFSYDYPVLLGIGVVLMVILIGVSLAVRSRRRRSLLYGPWP